MCVILFIWQRIFKSNMYSIFINFVLWIFDRCMFLVVVFCLFIIRVWHLRFSFEWSKDVLDTFSMQALLSSYKRRDKTMMWMKSDYLTFGYCWGLLIPQQDDPLSVLTVIISKISIVPFVSALTSSVHFKMVSIRSEMPIGAPSRLTEMFLVLSLKRFQCSSDWWRQSRPFKKDRRALPLSTPLCSRWSIVRDVNTYRGMGWELVFDVTIKTCVVRWWRAVFDIVTVSWTGLWFSDLCLQLVWENSECVIRPEVTRCGWRHVEIKQLTI